MRLSWFAQLFGKKKPAVAPASSPAATAPANGGSRYRGDASLHFRANAASGAAAAATATATSAARTTRSLPLASDGEAAATLPRRNSSNMTSPSATSPQTTDAASAEVAVVPSPSPGARHGADDVVKTTKMAPQEELALKVADGLKNLSTILSSIDEKMVHQHRATELVAERLQALPRVLEGLVAAERNNLETLRELRGAMEKQSEASLAASQKLEQLPTLVDGIGSRIDKQTEAAASVKTSVESVGSSVRGLVDGAQRAQSSLITEFRRGQDEQRLRLEQLVERQRKTIVIVAAIGAFVIIGLFIVLTRLPK